MTIIILLFSLFQIFKSQFNTQLTCPIYYCTDITAPTDGICLTFARSGNNGILQLKSCPHNQECDFYIWDPTHLNTVICKSIQINRYSSNSYGSLVEGDFCGGDSDCASNNCSKNNLCIGLNPGSKCTNTNECSASTYCQEFSKICTTRLNPGQACINDDNCINSSECLNGKCTKLYSLQSGYDIFPSNRTEFCFSNYSSSDSVCEDLINIGSPPYLCDANIGCYYTSSISNETVLINACDCDFRGNGFAYCMLGTTDPLYLQYINLIKQSFNYPCHYANKYKCNYTDPSLIMSQYNALNALSQVDSNVSCISPITNFDNPAINCPGNNPCNNDNFLRMNFIILMIYIFLFNL